MDISNLPDSWAPRLLNIDKKYKRALIANKNLKLGKDSPVTLLFCFIPVDETWFHYYMSESKRKSQRWKDLSSLAPKKTRSSLFSRKVIRTIVCDLKGIFLMDYHSKDHTINRIYYVAVLDKLKIAINEKNSHERKYYFIMTLPATNFIVVF